MEGGGTVRRYTAMPVIRIPGGMPDDRQAARLHDMGVMEWSYEPGVGIRARCECDAPDSAHASDLIVERLKTVFPRSRIVMGAAPRRTDA